MDAKEHKSKLSLHVLFGTVEQNQFKITHTDFFSLVQHFISYKNAKYFKELVAFLVRFLDTYAILRLLNAVIHTSIFRVISRNLKMRTRKVVKKACFI